MRIASLSAQALPADAGRPAGLTVQPIPARIAGELIRQHHYTGTMPGGTKLSFGAFGGTRLLGVITLGVGPTNAFALVDGAEPDDCLTLTRLWLADELPANSESMIIGMVLRAVKVQTDVGFLITYADPGYGHVGTIYQATNWLYTGVSQASPLYDLGDGQLHHSRSLGASYGSHSLSHFEKCGVVVKRIPQPGKHRYIYFLDKRWRSRLRVPVLPYPKREEDGR